VGLTDSACLGIAGAHVGKAAGLALVCPQPTQGLADVHATTAGNRDIIGWMWGAPGLPAALAARTGLPHLLQCHPTGSRIKFGSLADTARPVTQTVIHTRADLPYWRSFMELRR